MTVAIASPLAGWVTALDDVPDPVFAGRMLGDGVAIDPTEGEVTAPGPGVIVTLNPSRHAVTIELDSGVQLLIHIGIDTVALAGAGFTAHVTEGQRVAAGEALISFDMDYLARHARSLITPVIVTRGEGVSGSTERLVAGGAALLEVQATTGTSASDQAVQTSSRSLRLPLKHGLHARPAARIAELARGFEASVELRTQDGRTASALSPVAMLALTLAHGADVTVSAGGAQAEAAVAAIVDLIESGMGELAAVASDAATMPMAAFVAEPEPEPAAAPTGTLRGVTAAPGFAVGRSFRFDPLAVPAPSARGSGIGEERAALETARSVVRDYLRPRSLGQGAAAQVAQAHLAFLDDPALLGEAEKAIAAGASAGQAWIGAGKGFAAALAGGGDRFAERIDDLRDVERQVLAALAGEELDRAVPAGAILIAREILPSQLMALADASVGGICTAEGGPTSHAAIIAASMGVPMLTALGRAIERVADNIPLILDASKGIVIIDPSPAAQAAAAAEQGARDRDGAAARARQHEAAVTRDGKTIEVFANLGSLADAQAAVREGAEGCGLLRTEFLFLDRPSAPDEEEQRAAYQAIADALDGRPLIVRTLDIGADKPAPYLPMPAEENPALGVRGLRLGLARPELLRTQFRALIGVDAPGLKIMLPMVASASELTEARAILDREAIAMGRAAPPLGIMVETPAAALIADTLAADAAFFSIGSNDLSQYALAMDRGNAGTAAGLDALHPAVLRLIRATVDGGARHGRWTGVCGGVAADPQAVAILVGLGVTELSVPPAAVAEIKQIVRRIDMQGAMILAARACDAASAAVVRELVRAFMGGLA
ncbi:phosphoenolpyruvate--protein phosphotransferase [Sphingomonas crusticola]|uniref:phosphoenolpyruvate--protein phosphotransferase n=1 Tax=Sphingomonas crusticola TaxID=1697973 RepID=UPI000E25E07C|nr:phosphoenolpyruvate--protein phosphotransferase [Sphingomonas crusticola]